MNNCISLSVCLYPWGRLNAFDSAAIINQLESSAEKNIEALKLGKAANNFGVASEILRSEV